MPNGASRSRLVFWPKCRNKSILKRKPRDPTPAVLDAMSLILALEPSGLTGSVALSRGDIVLGTRLLEHPGRRHAQTLVAECQSLLNEHQLSPRDLHAVAATRGPGSFTG